MSKKQSLVEESLATLGLRAKDTVTGFVGVVSSVTFDLYGCVQVILTPPMNDKGELPESRWFDIKRMAFEWRVMERPKFEGKVSGDENGAGDRPRSMPR